MQNASMTLAPVPPSNTSQCRIVSSQNEDNYSGVNPVNLAAYADRMHRSSVDMLHYTTNTASCSGYSQNIDSSPTKFNSPIDLAVSTPRGGSQRADLNSGNPVNLAAYTRKELDCGIVLSSNLAANQTLNASVRSCDIGDQPLASSAQAISTDIKDQGTSSASAAPPQTYQGNSALIRTLASAASSQQTAAAYRHGLGLTHSLPSLTSYQSAHWRPLLSPHTTAQLVAGAVSGDVSGRAAHTDNTVKEREPDPLLLQLQVAFVSLCLRCAFLAVAVVLAAANNI